MTAVLRCSKCAKEYPVTNGIPRFVPTDGYSASFGYQWNIFRLQQLDSYNGTSLSARRFHGETGWSADDLRGKLVLDGGCGAGRFLDVASRMDCDVVGVDISSAVDAAAASVGDRPNVHLVQASLYALPFRPQQFDAVYCIGVVQHTPDPRGVVQALAAAVRPCGHLALTIYERRRFTTLGGKYLIRPVTRRLGNRPLLALVRGAMPILFPLTDILFRIPRLGRLFRFLIPVANYVDETSLSREQRYQWAILDTFDALSPRYDSPQREGDMVAVLRQAGLHSIERPPIRGLTLRAQR
jgi:SAM-dependent methyltransferase